MARASSRARCWIGGITITALLAAAGASAQAPRPSPDAEKSPPSQTGEVPAAAGTRDPFEPLVQPGEGESGIKQVTSLKLVGILWDVADQSQIQALVETPDGLGYYLRADEERFGGKVITIGRDRVRFAVREEDPSGQTRVRTVELKLHGE